ERILERCEHDVLARGLRVEMLEALRRAGAEDDVDRPALADVEPFLGVVGVVEDTVADLAARDLVDAQHLTLLDHEGAAVARRDHELFDDLSTHRFALLIAGPNGWPPAHARR